MDKQVFARLFERAADSHKYRYGHVLVIGGSPGMVGAPLLAGMAALRAGAGLVTIASMPEVIDKLERRVKEIMTFALTGREAAAAIQKFIEERKVSVVIIGPGMEPESAPLVEKLLPDTKLPLVIDGGALGALQHHTDRLQEAPSQVIVLTPHTGEFQKLVDKPLPEKRTDLKPIARAFAKAHGVTVVLKGEPTYVAHPDENLYENTTGNPGLATAGTGDVLTGVIAGLLAQGLEPHEAVEAAVYIHGLAGDIGAEAKTEPGMVASDVVEAIPQALRSISRSL